MILFQFSKRKDRFEIIVLGCKITFYRYLRMLRECYLIAHYRLLKETLKTKFQVELPKEAYHHLSGEVELVHVALKDIKMPWEGKRVSLTDTAVYKYLQSGKTDRFGYYYREADVFIPEAEEQSKQRMDSLEASLEQGYDPNRCVVVLTKNNVMVDGYHRCATLYHQFGGDYKILVVREKADSK